MLSKRLEECHLQEESMLEEQEIASICDMEQREMEQHFQKQLQDQEVISIQTGSTVSLAKRACDSYCKLYS